MLLERTRTHSHLLGTEGFSSFNTIIITLVCTFEKSILVSHLVSFPDDFSFKCLACEIISHLCGRLWMWNLKLEREAVIMKIHTLYFCKICSCSIDWPHSREIHAIATAQLVLTMELLWHTIMPKTFCCKDCLP